MRRYLLFQGDDYYAVGGWGDLAGAFDSIAEAEAAVTASENSKYGWWHVVDIEAAKIVTDGRRPQEYGK